MLLLTSVTDVMGGTTSAPIFITDIEGSMRDLTCVRWTLCGGFVEKM